MIMLTQTVVTKPSPYLPHAGSKASTATSAKSSAAPVPQCLPGLLSLDARPPLASNRPRCDSVLHLFGTWLFDAALANVKVLAVHKNAGKY